MTSLFKQAETGSPSEHFVFLLSHLSLNEECDAPLVVYMLACSYSNVVALCLMCQYDSHFQDVENFKKLNMISQDEFETLTPKLPIDPNQEVPPPPPCQTGDCTLYVSMR